MSKIESSPKSKVVSSRHAHGPEPVAPAEGILASAYEQVRAEADALTESEKRAYTLDAPYAAGVAQAAFQKCALLLPEVCALPKTDGARVKRIELYAHALLHVHAMVTSALVPRTLAEQATQATTMLVRLESCVDHLIDFGELEPGVVTAYRPAKRRSYQTMVTALIGFTSVLRGVWPAHGAKLLMPESDLAAAEKLAITMNVTLGGRDFTQGESAEWVERRQRVATLLVRAYTELRRGVAYLRFHEEDAGEFTPSIYVVGARGNGAASKADDAAKPADDAGAKGAPPKPAEGKTTEAKPVGPQGG